MDSAALCVAHPGADGRAVVDLVLEKPAPHSPAAVCQEFAGILKSYGIDTVVGDHYAGAWPVDEYQKVGIIYKTSESTKSELYLAGSRCSPPARSSCWTSRGSARSS